MQIAKRVEEGYQVAAPRRNVGEFRACLVRSGRLISATSAKTDRNMVRGAMRAIIW
jgi:hypothetical protein